MLLLLLTACGYGDCGDLKYFTFTDDARFDLDGDGYLDLQEACGADYGSFAFSYAPEAYTAIFFDSAEWDTADAAAVAYDYVPISEVVFRSDHLSEGASLGMAELDGFGLHKPRGPEDYTTTAFDLVEGTIDVLAGPRASSFEGDDWKLRVHLVFGAPDASAPAGWQTVDVEDWINVSPALGSWATYGSSQIAPPDAGT